MNRNKNIINTFLIIMVILLPPILLLTKSPLGFLNEFESNSLVGYFGSIVGGLFTILGVIFTIKNDKKEKKENLQIEFKPLLELTLPSSSIDKDYKHESYYDCIYRFTNKNEKADINSGIFSICVVNHGRGEARNVKIDIVPDTNCCYSNHESLEYKKDKIVIDELSPNNKYSIVFGFSKIPSNFQKFNFSMYIEYTDLFDEKQFRKKYIFEITKYNSGKINKLFPISVHLDLKTK